MTKTRIAFFAAAAGIGVVAATVAWRAHTLPRSSVEALTPSPDDFAGRRGERLVGMVRSVHDGDTVRIFYGSGRQSFSVRIFGIDAPELAQRCGAAYWRNDCGKTARDALEGMMGGRMVSCEIKDRHRRRLVAICSAGGVDFGRSMVRRGLAVEYRRYSRGIYTAEQTAAQAEKAGLWGMAFEQPARWRQCNMPQYRNRRPADCRL